MWVSNKLNSCREPQIFILADTLQRTQAIRFDELYPYRTDGKCRCGCKNDLPSYRPVWYSRHHANMAVHQWRLLIGDPSTVRRALFRRDKGKCNRCGILVLKWRKSRRGRVYKRVAWEAHHKLAVVLGGGFCTLDDYETLCPKCHQKETKKLRKYLAKHGKTPPLKRFVSVCSLPLTRLPK
jgi:5-methylcytosine-specific restriction endonuclease McrA